MSTASVTSLRPPAWDVVDWTAHWERLAAERDRLATEKAQLEGGVEALTDQRKALVGDVTHRTGRKAALDKELGQLSSKIDVKKGALRLIDAEGDALARRRQDLDDEVRRLQSERDALQSEAERVRADLDARSAELDVRSVELDARQTAMDALSAQLIERGSELDAREAQVEPRVSALLASRTQVLEGRERELRIKEMFQQRALYKEWAAIVGAVVVGLVIAFFAYTVGVESRP